MPPFLHASACIILYPPYYNHMNKLTCSGETMKQNSFPFRYLSTQTPCTRCLSPPFQFSLYSRKSNLSGKIYKQLKLTCNPQFFLWVNISHHTNKRSTLAVKLILKCCSKFKKKLLLKAQR